MKRKTALATLFAAAVLGFGDARAQQKPATVPDPETKAILQSVGMTYEHAKEIAGGKKVVVYYDFFDDAGDAHASSTDTGCFIDWSEYGEGLDAGFTRADAAAIGLKYDHRIDHDIEKITMLHELSHCTPKPGSKDIEFNADEKALGIYLAEGGSADTAKYWAYWRVLSPVIYPEKYGSSAENPYVTIGPRLMARFFGAEPVDLDTSRAAYTEVLGAIKTYGQGAEKPEWFVGKRKASRALVRDILADEKLSLSPPARSLLRLYDEAYNFLQKGPPTRTAQAMPGKGFRP